MVDTKRPRGKAMPPGSAIVVHKDGSHAYWPSFEIEDRAYVAKHMPESAEWVIRHSRSGRYEVGTPPFLGHPFFPQTGLETFEAALMWINLRG